MSPCCLFLFIILAFAKPIKGQNIGSKMVEGHNLLIGKWFTLASNNPAWLSGDKVNIERIFIQGPKQGFIENLCYHYKQKTQCILFESKAKKTDGVFVSNKSAFKLHKPKQWSVRLLTLDDSLLLLSYYYHNREMLELLSPHTKLKPGLLLQLNKQIIQHGDTLLALIRAGSCNMCPNRTLP